MPLPSEPADLKSATGIQRSGQIGYLRIDGKADLIRCGRGLAKNAIRSHLVLFIGAGASAGAGLPQWTDLLAGVAKDAGMEPESRKHLRDKDPRDQATILEGRLKGQDLDLKKLKEAVAQKLDSSHYALLHGLLASLPSTEAVTHHQL